MSYKKARFTLPASGKAVDNCDLGHIPSGPARRRVCVRCGALIPKDGVVNMAIRGGTGTIVSDGFKPDPMYQGVETREAGAHGLEHRFVSSDHVVAFIRSTDPGPDNALCAARNLTRICTLPAGHLGDHCERLSETETMEWANATSLPQHDLDERNRLGRATTADLEHIRERTR